MKLVSYQGQSGWRAGVVVDGDVVDAQAALEAAGLQSPSANGPVSVRNLLTDQLVGGQLAAAARQVHDDGGAVRGPVLGPPVPDPDKILCFGVNYKAHAEEAAVDLPVVPMLFAKFPNSLIGHGQPIVRPPASTKVDYEGELAVVIGRRCRNVTASEALSYVIGAMPFNDVTARDLQLEVSQWTTGKAADTFGPCGPELVTLDEIGPLDNLTLTTTVNGATVQHANTKMMVFGVAELVAFLSRTMTLEPGDIIATGTPEGVGFKRTPPILLTAGDVVDVEINGVGRLSNPVIDESVAPGLSTASPSDARL